MSSLLVTLILDFATSIAALTNRRAREELHPLPFHLPLRAAAGEGGLSDTCFDRKIEDKKCDCCKNSNWSGKRRQKHGKRPRTPVGHATRTELHITYFNVTL